MSFNETQILIKFAQTLPMCKQKKGKNEKLNLKNPSRMLKTTSSKRISLEIAKLLKRKGKMNLRI